jgi:predicted Ser/Thr protein kinase
MEELVEAERKRKSLAVDQTTYDMLQEICNEKGWTKIEALKRLISSERNRIEDEKMGHKVISRP